MKLFVKKKIKMDKNNIKEIQFHKFLKLVASALFLSVYNCRALFRQFPEV
jgi:hypothetical protein